MNVKTAEPIGTKFCVGNHVTPGKVIYEWSKFLKFVFKTFLFLSNFKNAQKISEIRILKKFILYKEKMLKVKAAQR